MLVGFIFCSSFCQISKYMAKKVPGLHVHSLMIGDNVIQVIFNSNVVTIIFVIILLIIIAMDSIKVILPRDTIIIMNKNQIKVSQDTENGFFMNVNSQISLACERYLLTSLLSSTFPWSLLSSELSKEDKKWNIQRAHH